jgi:hypothetical protein
MSWWDDQLKHMAQHERFGRDAVTGAVLGAGAISRRHDGHPVEEHPTGTAVRAADLKAAIAEQLLSLLQVH